jgi:hypothetical protein
MRKTNLFSSQVFPAALATEGRIPHGVATYAGSIKNKASRTSASRVATRKAAPAAPTPPAAPASPAARPDEAQRLKDELQRVNRELSKFGRATRPDDVRQTHLPEKQELLRQKVVLESKIRALPKP